MTPSSFRSIPTLQVYPAVDMYCHNIKVFDHLIAPSLLMMMSCLHVGLCKYLALHARSLQLRVSSVCQLCHTAVSHSLLQLLFVCNSS